MTATRPNVTLEQLRAELRGLWQILPGLAPHACADRRSDTTKGG